MCFVWLLYVCKLTGVYRKDRSDISMACKGFYDMILLEKGIYMWQGL